MMSPTLIGSGSRLMADPMSRSEEIKAAVARTLTQVAQWGIVYPDELMEVARLVAGLAPGDLPCPMCEEIECDAGCALEPVRSVNTDD